MSGVRLWYEIQVMLRDSDPLEFGPVRLDVAHTDNPEMAVDILQQNINEQWIAAMRDGRLWEILSDKTGFILVNPQLVQAVSAQVVDPPEQESADEQADAPAASAGASELEDEDLAA